MAITDNPNDNSFRVINYKVYQESTVDLIIFVIMICICLKIFLQYFGNKYKIMIIICQVVKNLSDGPVWLTLTMSKFDIFYLNTSSLMPALMFSSTYVTFFC